MIALALIAFTAAVVNGALGYGFSSVAVPLALLVISNRALNPALVLVELVLNLHVLWTSRAAFPRVRGTAAVILMGLLPGVVLGGIALTRVDARWLRLATFALLLPLILAQAAGVQRARRAGRSTMLAFGTALGALYAATTISGPPLSMFLGSQGYGKHEFRATIGVVRFGAAVITVTWYARVGLVAREGLPVVAYMIPGVLLGLPVGAWIVRRVGERSFRRAAMRFDAIVIAFGLSMALRQLGLVAGLAAFTPLAAVLGLHAIDLSRAIHKTLFRVPECTQS